jgi:predicted DNA-binding protein YlxM (UPF0122 family)
MKITNLPQLSEVLVVLKNINDNIRRCEDNLFSICTKLNQMENEKPTPTKHIVVLRKEDKKM